jgi:hypothetical protein
MRRAAEQRLQELVLDPEIGADASEESRYSHNPATIQSAVADGGEAGRHVGYNVLLMRGSHKFVTQQLIAPSLAIQALRVHKRDNKFPLNSSMAPYHSRPTRPLRRKGCTMLARKHLPGGRYQTPLLLLIPQDQHPTSQILSPLAILSMEVLPQTRRSIFYWVVSILMIVRTRVRCRILASRSTEEKPRTISQMTMFSFRRNRCGGVRLFLEVLRCASVTHRVKFQIHE